MQGLRGEGDQYPTADGLSPRRVIGGLRRPRGARPRAVAGARPVRREPAAQGGRPGVGVLRGAADGQRPARSPPRLGPLLQGPLPPLPHDAGPLRGPQGRVGLPRPAGRGGDRAGAGSVGEDPDPRVRPTTPWTLTSNVAAAVGPDVDYARVRRPGVERDVVLARDRVEAVLGPADEAGWEIVATMRAADLAGLHYERPFDFVPTDPDA